MGRRRRIESNWRRQYLQREGFLFSGEFGRETGTKSSNGEAGSLVDETGIGEAVGHLIALPPLWASWPKQC